MRRNIVLLAIVSGCSLSPSQVDQMTNIDRAFTQGQRFVALDVASTDGRQAGRLAHAGMNIWAHFGDRLRGTVDKPSWQRVRAWNLKVQMLPTTTGFQHYDPRYHTYRQVSDAIATLAEQHPSIAKLETLGNSFEGRPIFTLHLGDDGPGKTAVAFSGGTHARELVPPELVLETAKWLLAGQDSVAKAAVASCSIYLTPIVNPDGHVRAEKDLDWRKNADPSGLASESVPSAGGNQDAQGIGVDLNRNYASRSWGGAGASRQPIEGTFCGPNPGSEPETQSMERLYRDHSIRVLLTWHAFGNQFLWPWNDAEAPPDDPRLSTIGTALGRLAGYEAMQGVFDYPTTGEETDFAYGQLGILAFLAEVGDLNDGFDPPYKRVAAIWAQNLPMVRHLLTLASSGPLAASPPAASPPPGPALLSSGLLTYQVGAVQLAMQTASSR